MIDDESVAVDTEIYLSTLIIFWCHNPPCYYNHLIQNKYFESPNLKSRDF